MLLVQDYYERGVQPAQGYRNGYRTGFEDRFVDGITERIRLARQARGGLVDNTVWIVKFLGGSQTHPSG